MLIRRQNNPMANRDSLLIFLVGVVIFMVGLSPEITGFDCRFAMFAQEMLRNGPTFFPTTYGRPYPDYPATSTFLIYLASLPFGKVTPFTATLPVSVASALILVVIYRIGAIHSRQWGLYAVLIALFTKEFLSRSRSLTIDQYVSLVTALCFYLAYSVDVYNKNKRLWFVPLLFVVGFAFRGPIGLVIPAAVVCTYYLLNRNFKLFSLITVISLILFILCFKGLLLVAAYQGGTKFADDVWKGQMAGRIYEGKHWLGYYWTDSFAKYAVAYPFAVLVGVALFKQIIRRENTDYKFLAHLLLWIFIVILGLSIPSTKKMRYIVSIVPAAALVASYMFVKPLQKGILFAVRKIFLNFCYWFPVGTGIFALIVWAFGARIAAFAEKFSGEQISALLSGFYLVTFFLMAILTVVVWYINVRVKDGLVKDLVFIAVGVATFIIITICIEEPISYCRNRTKPFVEKMEMLQRQKQGEIIFYKIPADGEAIKFMINFDKPIKPKFIKSPKAILSCKESAYFIAKAWDFADLPKDVAQHVTLLAEGKIGGDDFVVFTLIYNNRIITSANAHGV